ncbi:MAG: phosphoribulokinase [Mariprofundaceae bacterium]
MSAKHPIVAITGSSGAGTSTAKVALEHIFRREEVVPAIVEGDCFHKFDRAGFKSAAKEYEKRGERLSHFSPDANVFDKLELLFKEYGENGSGLARTYLHDAEEAAPYNQEPGTFTPWERVGGDSNLLFYEGLHGGVITPEVNVAQYTDLLVGIVPVVNLEWIQKIHRDTKKRGYSDEAVVDNILQRMHDYVHYITPQFVHTDINFQRVPVVDTSHPFVARDVPTSDESLVVIRIRKPARWGIDFPYLLSMLNGSFMSRRNTIVVPAGKMLLAMEIILTPIIHMLMENARKSDS